MILSATKTIIKLQVLSVKSKTCILAVTVMIAFKILPPGTRCKISNKSIPTCIAQIGASRQVLSTQH